MIRSALVVVLLTSALAAGADEVATAAPSFGTTIVGDQDAALGLYLMPWKDERPSRISRAPGLHDEQPALIDSQAYARTSTYYATGRAYRAERLQRNH